MYGMEAKGNIEKCEAVKAFIDFSDRCARKAEVVYESWEGTFKVCRECCREYMQRLWADEEFWKNARYQPSIYPIW